MYIYIYKTVSAVIISQTIFASQHQVPSVPSLTTQCRRHPNTTYARSYAADSKNSLMNPADVFLGVLVVLFNVLCEGYVDVATQEGVVLGLDEVFVVLFH